MEEKVLWLDALSGRFFDASFKDLRNVMVKINSIRLDGDVVYLNDVYEEIDKVTEKLHIRPNEVGYHIGWGLFEDDPTLIDFEAIADRTDDGETYYSIYFVPNPTFQ